MVLRSIPCVFGSVLVLTVASAACGSRSDPHAPAVSTPPVAAETPRPPAPATPAPSPTPPTPSPTPPSPNPTPPTPTPPKPTPAARELPPRPPWIRHPLRPFSIMATEVSVSQFRLCVDAKACAPDHFDIKCNFGRADRRDHPMNCVSHDGAEQYCRSAGGRLCSEDEWLAACSGEDNRAFPYGDFFDPAACNSHSRAAMAPGDKPSTSPVGHYDSCEGGLDGLHDMAGNVHEWVATCKGTYCKFRGGAFLSNDPVERFAACRGVCSGNQKSFRSGTVGFRCCRDETP